MPCATASSSSISLPPCCSGGSIVASLLQAFRGFSDASERHLPLRNCLRLELNEGVQHHPNAPLLLKAAPGFAAELAVLASLQRTLAGTSRSPSTLTRVCSASTAITELQTSCFWMLVGVIYLFYFSHWWETRVGKTAFGDACSPLAESCPSGCPEVPGASARRAGGPARERRTRQRVLCLHRLSPLQLFGTCLCLCA